MLISGRVCFEPYWIQWGLLCLKYRAQARACALELYNRYEIAPLLFAYLKERCLQATANLFMFFYLVNSEINDWERKEKGLGSSKLTSRTILCSPVSASNKTKKERLRVLLCDNKGDALTFLVYKIVKPSFSSLITCDQVLLLPGLFHESTNKP